MNGENNQKSGGISFGAKVGYIGTGVMIGLIAYPFVKKFIAQVQPKMDELLNNLTGRAEAMAESASDLFAKAKNSFGGGATASKETNGGGHEGHLHS